MGDFVSMLVWNEKNYSSSLLYIYYLIIFFKNATILKVNNIFYL